MLKTLRLRFIVTNMSLVTLVLVVVIASIGISSYSSREAEVYSALSHRTGQPVDGTLQMKGLNQNNVPFDKGAENDNEPMRDAGNDQLVATSCYLIDEDGSIIQSFEGSLSLDAESAQSAAEEALAAYRAAGDTKTTGMIEPLSLYYCIDGSAEGIRMSVASDKYVVGNAIALVTTLFGIGLLAWLAFFIVSLFLSRLALRPVERAWSQQQQFVADASHELKTPLTVMRANNAILLSQPEKTIAEQMQWVESNESEAESMQGLVNDLLMLATPENARSQQVFGVVDFSFVVQSAVLQFESVAFERNVSFDSNVEEGLRVRGDDSRLQRLVSILLDNALKYVDERGSVNISLNRDGTNCLLTVCNTGTPIDAEDIDRLFDRFYRGDKARTRGQGGYGLGLSIAQDTVMAHKGSIAVKSDEASGTVFSVLLPLSL